MKKPVDKNTSPDKQAPPDPPAASSAGPGARTGRKAFFGWAAAGILSGALSMAFAVHAANASPSAGFYHSAVAAAVVVAFLSSFTPFVVRLPVMSRVGESDGAEKKLKIFLLQILRAFSGCLVFIVGAALGQAATGFLIAPGQISPPALAWTVIHQVFLTAAVFSVILFGKALTGRELAARGCGLALWLLLWWLPFFSQPWIMNAGVSERAVKAELRRLEDNEKTAALLEGLDEVGREKFYSRQAAANAETRVRASRLASVLAWMPYAAYPRLWDSACREKNCARPDLLMGAVSYRTWIGSDEPFEYPGMPAILGRLFFLIAACFAATLLIYRLKLLRNLPADEVKKEE